MPALPRMMWDVADPAENDRPTDQIALADEPSCPECGYDLRGIASDRCPECGFAVDRASMSVSRIPWEHRKQSGRWRAYWRTNLLVLFRPSLLAEEMNRRIDYQSARRFRNVTVLLATIPAAAWAIALYFTRFEMRDVLPRSSAGWFLQGLALVMALAGVWLFLLGISASGSYFFHPRNLPMRRQNRAVALSHYGCAALGWLLLPAILLALGRAAPGGSYGSDERLSFPLQTAAIALVVAIVIAFWARTIQLMRRTTRSGTLRTIAFAAYLPVSWLVLFGLCWGLVGAVLLISLMIVSLS